jgi:hypothetical protein
VWLGVGVVTTAGLVSAWLSGKGVVCVGVDEDEGISELLGSVAGT